jgi:hypothetical protein
MISAIFVNFLGKNWHFFSNLTLLFTQTSSDMGKKRQLVCQMFLQNFFKNYNIGPDRQGGFKT